MARSKLLPSNKWYVLVLCCILVGGGIFISNSVVKGLQAWNTTLRGHPIKQEDGKRWVWAKGDLKSDSAEWFDVTNSAIDPRKFNHGIGKDTIPSIDDPYFVTADDPVFGPDGPKGHFPVIGVVVEGEARAYPIRIMDRHELVNDSFGDIHLTVAW